MRHSTLVIVHVAKHLAHVGGRVAAILLPCPNGHIDDLTPGGAHCINQSSGVWNHRTVDAGKAPVGCSQTLFLHTFGKGAVTVACCVLHIDDDQRRTFWICRAVLVVGLHVIGGFGKIGHV